MMEYRKYNLETYTLPFWEGDTIYNESIMFIDENEAPLLYYPEKVISVLSPDLKTEYIEGKDFVVENGKIKLTENSRIFVTSLEEFFPENPKQGTYFETTVPGFKYIMFGEGDFMFKRQVFVTYTHKDVWTGFVPKKSNKLNRFIEKAKSGEEVTVLFFGDSWCTMVVKTMGKFFGNENIKYVNTAVGGMNTQWGLDTIKENAIDYNPDLMIFAFGMNDSGRPTEEFVELTKAAIDKYVEACPESDVAIISTMLPHFRLKGFWGNQRYHEESLKRMLLCYENADLIPMTSVHKALLERKRYYDMSGNNVNHPNDFLARVYAQTLIKVILG